MYLARYPVALLHYRIYLFCNCLDMTNRSVLSKIIGFGNWFLVYIDSMRMVLYLANFFFMLIIFFLTIQICQMLMNGGAYLLPFKYSSKRQMSTPFNFQLLIVSGLFVCDINRSTLIHLISLLAATFCIDSRPSKLFYMFILF